MAARRASPKTSHSYYVVMQEYPRRVLPNGTIVPRRVLPNGTIVAASEEAIVKPEYTRRNIIDMIASGELRDITFIHHVDGLYVYDCTAELLEEANTALLQAAE